MSIFAAMGIQFFEGEEAWAQGNALWVKQNTEALAQQSALVNTGLGGSELTSWFGAFELQENGDFRLIEGWHLGPDGTVTQGLPVEGDESLEPEPTGTPPAWQPWNGHPDSLHQIGDVVTHNGSTWTSITSNNHWEPGEYGWELVS